ncbi:hypothetical protein A9Q88_12285 [Gammaproteobacteria bacterium 50_400_T64]|nr:hypothetical protein A9Q88_12285 [Gammaproteobacteria bacterium 50_400_T64]
MKKIKSDSNPVLAPTPPTSETSKASPPGSQPKAVNHELTLDANKAQSPTQQDSSTKGPTQETLQMSLLFLMSKFALTQEKSYAEAAYQHLHMLAVRCDTDSKPRFLYRSLAMDWVQMCRGQITTDDRPRTGPH